MPSTMIEIPQAHEVTIPGPDVLKTWLEDMLRIREFEVRSMQAYQNKLAGGFLHVYNVRKRRRRLRAAMRRPIP